MVWGLLAASLAAVALGVSVVRDPSPAVLATYQAPQDRTLTVTLADGSYVRLAPGSGLQELDAREERDVTLTGRAFFAVARDEGRPFVVNAGAGEIRVLGTRFQVQEGEDGEVRTAVIEGRVAVAGREGRVEIGPGQLALLSEGAPPTISQPEDIYALLDWPEGILVFQGTPLHKVAEDISRHFQRPLEVTGEELRNRRVTAWFGPEGFDEVAESLCLVTEARCLGSRDGVVMAPRSGEGGGS
jgi:transmembrane sensor